jgi:hypothetical protein
MWWLFVLVGTWCLVPQGYSAYKTFRLGRDLVNRGRSPYLLVELVQGGFEGLMERLGEEGMWALARRNRSFRQALSDLMEDDVFPRWVATWWVLRSLFWPLYWRKTVATFTMLAVILEEETAPFRVRHRDLDT